MQALTPMLSCPDCTGDTLPLKLRMYLCASRCTGRAGGTGCKSALVQKGTSEATAAVLHLPHL